MTDARTNKAVHNAFSDVAAIRLQAEMLMLDAEQSSQLTPRMREALQAIVARTHILQDTLGPLLKDER